jgi:hypothetical protein
LDVTGNIYLESSITSNRYILPQLPEYATKKALFTEQ